MHVPKYWARVCDENRCSLGWSDVGPAEAERHARERLASARARAANPAESSWDYYPERPVKEEILARPDAQGVEVILTRNRAGARVLNTDRVAFVDIDLPEPKVSFSLFRSIFGKRNAERDASREQAALVVVRSWTERNSALVRAYRTARGLRLLRMDRLMDPAGAETQRMFTELGTDPQYQRLCKAQQSFRARLSPKPLRVGCAPSPGSHPRTERAMERAFGAWLAGYETACKGHAVCALVYTYGSARPLEAAQFVATLHDQHTLRAGLELA